MCLKACWAPPSSPRPHRLARTGPVSHAIVSLRAIPCGILPQSRLAQPRASIWPCHIYFHDGPELVIGSGADAAGGGSGERSGAGRRAWAHCPHLRPGAIHLLLPRGCYPQQPQLSHKRQQVRPNPFCHCASKQHCLVHPQSFGSTHAQTALHKSALTSSLLCACPSRGSCSHTQEWRP